MTESIYVDWGTNESSKDKMLRDMLKQVFSPSNIQVLLTLSEQGKDQIVRLFQEASYHVNKELTNGR